MIEFTILLPCLNEADSLAFCIQEAKESIKREKIEAEILIADNGSSDGSVDIARENGARVISVVERGYGACLRGGIEDARGKYIIMADSDGSYDLSNLGPFIEGIRQGYSLVIGNRFKGGIESGAMPWLHKLGVPFLSLLARLRFKCNVYDFHCGLRSFDREEALALDLTCTGMEFATEIIAKFAMSKAKILEVPTILRKDKRQTSTRHLRTFKDGFRHLKYILLYHKY
ncbi:MAG: glycosyltransferase family 2 protein [Erysipelotrichaceae bacterium]|nr:glycosyltransferase family 2 protein [Erysipelotrichaceae bacterium]MBR3693739.1 glycosyltransferase family 2 protein [Erysipelotrichales bacterium]